MLSQISSEFFARSPVLLLPVIALCLFGAVFLLVLARTVLAGRDEIERGAQLPLSDDEVKDG